MQMLLNQSFLYMQVPNQTNSSNSRNALRSRSPHANHRAGMADGAQMSGANAAGKAASDWEAVRGA
ncbi:hypothetical protein, partial [Vogesella mureinivorans]|uniref:hypothetical protein n=1 Tax=Vogesella mureinivorans TaxID=657276 RepID=UPI00197CD57F